MLADERKLRKAKSVIQHHHHPPSAIRIPRYFYVKASQQPIKYHQEPKAYHYSDQSTFLASREAQVDFKLMSGRFISSPPHLLVRLRPFLWFFYHHWFCSYMCAKYLTSK
jgi:hypothetical protein